MSHPEQLCVLPSVMPSLKGISVSKCESTNVLLEYVSINCSETTPYREMRFLSFFRNRIVFIKLVQPIEKPASRYSSEPSELLRCLPHLLQAHREFNFPMIFFKWPSIAASFCSWASGHGSVGRRKNCVWNGRLRQICFTDRAELQKKYDRACLNPSDQCFTLVNGAD